MKHRILYLEHSTDGTVGGSHLCLLEICRHLDSSRYQAVVCFFERNTLVDEFRKAGAEVVFRDPPHAWRVPWLPGIVGRPLAIAVNLFRTLVSRTAGWLRFLKAQRIDLVHINNACGFDHDLMLACRLSRTPCVVHERGIQPHINLRSRYFANRADRLVAISDAVADNMRRHGIRADRIVRIDDGIDPDRLVARESREAVRTRLNIPLDVSVIGIVGNIKHWKGQHVVVEAFGILRGKYPDLRCMLVGSMADEAYGERLRSRARELGIPTDALVFTGYEPHPTDLMRAMDVVIHASVLPEPFGIVLLEAMAVKRPLIASRDGAPVAIVEHGRTGLLSPPGDPSALAEAVSSLLNAPANAEAMVERAHRRFLERYTIHTTMAALGQLYSTLLSR